MGCVKSEYEPRSDQSEVAMARLRWSGGTRRDNAERNMRRRQDISTCLLRVPTQSFSITCVLLCGDESLRFFLSRAQTRPHDAPCPSPAMYTTPQSRHKRAPSPPLSVTGSSQFTSTPQQKLNVVTRLALEGKAKHGDDGATIRMYIKV